MKTLSILLLISSINVYALDISNESELSIIQTGGNSNVATYNVKTQTKFSYQKYSNTIGGHYFLSVYEDDNDNGDTVDIESARNWDIFVKTERIYSKRFNFFTQVQMEGDTFSGFTQRDNYDIGIKYKIIEIEKVNFFTELGYRYSVEHKDTAEENESSVKPSNKGRWAISYEKKHTQALTYKFNMEYLPNFSYGEDYIVNLEPALSFLLTNIFSLKFSYLSTYDNLPADASNEKLDFKYTTSLIAKY